MKSFICYLALLPERDFWGHIEQQPNFYFFLEGPNVGGGREPLKEGPKLLLDPEPQPSPKYSQPSALSSQNAETVNPKHLTQTHKIYL